MLTLVILFILSHQVPLFAQPATQPLTLEESVAIAARHSPQARAARFAKEAAQAQADRERPVARPTLNAVAAGTAQGTRQTLSLGDGTTGVALPDLAGQLSLVLEQPLYRAGLGAAKQRYAAQSAIVEQDYRLALAQIALAVRKAYLDVLRAESGVRAAQDGLEVAQRYQAFVEKQIAAGLTRPVDAQTVAGLVAEAQSGLTQAEGGLLLARMNFNRALGRPLEMPVTLEPVTTLPAIPDSPAAAIAAAWQQRSELLSLAQNLRSAQAGVSLARAQSQPTLSFRGEITQQTPTIAAPQTYTAATLELRWPILDAGKTRDDLREAQAQAQRLQALTEEARQGIALDVMQAWQKMRQARDRIVLAQTQHQAAEATAVVAEKAYEIGRGTVFEMQAAQRELRATREREIQARYDLHIAAAEFAHAQGDLTLLAPRPNPPAPPSLKERRDAFGSLLPELGEGPRARASQKSLPFPAERSERSREGGQGVRS